MSYDMPPQAQVQQADAEATRRAQEHQKQLAHQQLNEQRQQQQQRETALAAEMAQRAEQTGQG